MPLGIKNSTGSAPSSGDTITFCLPLISFPKEMMPEHSAIIARSFGFLASNNSATRGSPPVISLFFVPAFGVLAKISPACTSAPSATERIESGGRKYRASLSFAKSITSPFASRKVILGLRSAPFASDFQSLTFV